MQTTNVKISNGTITLPQVLIEQLNLKGERIVQARIEGGDVVIEVGKNTQAPYRVLTDADIDQFLKDDQLPKPLIKKIQSRLSANK